MAIEWPAGATCGECGYWRMRWMQEFNGERRGQGECSYLSPAVGCAVVVDMEYGCRAWEPKR